MSLNAEEKSLVQEALQVYIQLVAQQAGPAQAQGLLVTAKSILQKLENPSPSVSEDGSNQPSGISDEWFENVCATCAHLTPTGCSDKVTAKYPGKCDPILTYENKKRIAAR